MFRRFARSPFLAVLALLISVLPAVAPVRASDRQQQPGGAGSPAIGLKITLPTHDLSTSSIRPVNGGFTLALTNSLAVFYSVNPLKSVVTSPSLLWGRGLLGPKQQVTLSVALSTSGQGVLLTLNPTATRAVTLNELVIAINLVEVYLGLDVDPVAVLTAAPDLISVGAELLGASEYSAPLGALQKILAADSLPDRAQAITGLSTSLATVLAKPALVKRLAPLIAVGLSAASRSTVTPKSVTTAMSGLTPVLNGLSRLISGGRIGAMFLDFGKLIAERVSSPDNNAFAPLIPFRLVATPTPIVPPASRVRFDTIDDPNAIGRNQVYGITPRGTDANGINPQGDIVGYYLGNANNVVHGFLLHQGHYRTIDDPLAVDGTYPMGINPQGDIVGTYIGSNGINHGFLLHQGTYTIIDDPYSSEGTAATGINPQGDIVGYYNLRFTNYHGFLLHQGTYTTIDDPKGKFTTANGINPQGDIVGEYSNPFTSHGYLRHQGSYTTIDDPIGAAVGRNPEIAAVSINPQGDIVGTYHDSAEAVHGFLLHQGRYTTIDDPKAGHGINQGTRALGINPQGDIVGDYVDSAGADHGFLRHTGP